MEVEIKGFGVFKIKHNYLHRGRSRLVTYDTARFKEIQFDSYIENPRNPFQRGYDYNGEEILIKVLIPNQQ